MQSKSCCYHRDVDLHGQKLVVNKLNQDHQQDYVIPKIWHVKSVTGPKEGVQPPENEEHQTGNAVGKEDQEKLAMGAD